MFCKTKWIFDRLVWGKEWTQTRLLTVPVFFKLYINDLALKIHALGKGIIIDDELESILLYADDVVLLAENEADLQAMHNVSGGWCKTNILFINASKSNIVHSTIPL